MTGEPGGHDVRSEVERDLHEAVSRVFRRKDFERTVADRKERT